MEPIGLRYFNVYGPRQDPAGPYSAVIPRFFRALIDGESPVICVDGEQSRDFTLVEDAVRANLLAAGAPPEASGAADNVACGRQTSVKELARIPGAIIGHHWDPIYESPRPGDAPHSVADLSLARRYLGFEAGVGLSEGLRLSRSFYEGDRR